MKVQRFLFKDNGSKKVDDEGMDLFESFCVSLCVFICLDVSLCVSLYIFMCLYVSLCVFICLDDDEDTKGVCVVCLVQILLQLHSRLM